MIPGFDSNGNLPPGVHTATWGQFCGHFGHSEHRKNLLAGLVAALNASGKAFLDFFQTDKRTGEPKGIVSMDLGGLK